MSDDVFDGGYETGGIGVRGWYPGGAFHCSGETTDVVVHWVDDEDGVAETVELTGEIDGDGEAAIGEEDI